MADCFFNTPRYRAVQNPVNGGWNNYPYTQLPTKAPPSSKKVIEIPVHFVGTEKRRSSIAALKIQKVFRGFLVKKSVKKIVQIKREVDEIAKKISQKEVIDLICRDGKERLRFNEMLMGLLLKLDSIRGIDSGVRDCRKAVIKKAIMLQERLDSIVAEDLASEMANSGESKDQENVEPEPELGSVEPVRDGEEPMVEFPEKSQFNADQCECDSGNGGGGDSMVELQEKSQFKADNEGSEMVENVKEEDKVMEWVEEGKEEDLKKEEVEEMVMETQEPELIQVDQVGETMDAEDGVKCGRSGGGGDDSKDLMVKMIEGNEKLTGLVAELCERNEMQTRLISSLSQRVENLEKAWKSERLRRKKKRTDTSSNATKCGRRS